jgi:hypothetical protein
VSPEDALKNALEKKVQLQAELETFQTTGEMGKTLEPYWKEFLAFGYQDPSPVGFTNMMVQILHGEIPFELQKTPPVASRPPNISMASATAPYKPSAQSIYEPSRMKAVPYPGQNYFTQHINRLWPKK